MSIRFFLCYFLCFASVHCGNENEFQVYGNVFTRNTYEYVDFHDYSIEEFFSKNHTLQEYKIFIKEGLNRYLTFIRILKKMEEALVEHAIEDSLNTTVVNANKTNIALEHVRGLSKITTMDPHLTALDEHKFEIQSTFNFPEITFDGFIKDKNSSFEYKLIDVNYVKSERKKMNDRFEIEQLQNTDQFNFTKTKLTIPAETIPLNSTIEDTIKNLISLYLPEISDTIKRNTKNYSIEADTWYLRIKRDDILHKLSQLVSKASKTFNNTVSYHLPRFIFSDQKTLTEYEMISGTLEIDLTTVQASAKSLTNTNGIEFSSSVLGSLTYYVSENNCNESCYFYGHRFNVQKINVRLVFTDKEVDKIEWYFEMKYSESLVDNHQKTIGYDLFDIILDSVSKIVNNKFLKYMKAFLK